MHGKVLISTVLAASLSACLFVEVTSAQERHATPAFPIAVGEQMLVFTGEEIAEGYGSFSSPSSGSANTYTSTTSNTISLKLDLPVGAKIKRILGEFVDQAPSAGEDISVRLIRVPLNSSSPIIILRSFTTSGISSSSDTDFQQAISNPLNHATLQGWMYAIEIEYPGKTGRNELITGHIKIIYEP